MTRRTTTNAALIIAAASLTAAGAHAFPVTTVFLDTPGCDVLAGPLHSDELGFTPPFPPDESITATDTITPSPACPGSDIPGFANALVFITNLTTRSFYDLWYVGEPNFTSFTNIDGTVNGADAFKIDTVGVNRPLVSESILADGIFSPGETWQFIIDDYFNAAGFPASAFTSLGVPSLGGSSSGSIVANPVPAPGSIALILGAGGLVSTRRRRR